MLQNCIVTGLPITVFFFSGLPRFRKFDKVRFNILFASRRMRAAHAHINTYTRRYYKIIATSMLSAPSVQSGARRYTERYAPRGIMEPIGRRSGPPREMRVPHRIGLVPFPPAPPPSSSFLLSSLWGPPVPEIMR